MVVFSRPAAGRQLRNFPILDLEGDPLTVRDRWTRAVLDYRTWCYNSTGERYEFGNKFRRAAMIPSSGYFCFYLLLKGKWLCLLIDGPTSYLIAFITSTIGNDDEMRIREMYRRDGRKYISGSKYMPWDGRYRSPEDAPVGYDGLHLAFLGMYRYVTTGNLPKPNSRNLQKWCDIFVIHFPEAGRFDSLLMCNIYKRFADGGQIGNIPIERARSWSKDCMYVLERTTEKVLTKGKNKWKVTGGGSKASKLPKEQKQVKCKRNRYAQNNRAKVPSYSEDETCYDEFDEVKDKRFMRTMQDVRLFHREYPVTADISIGSLPIKLLNGEAINPPTELDNSDADFLLIPFGKLSHDSCTYTNGKWVCKVSEAGMGSSDTSQSPLLLGQDSSSNMELGVTPDNACQVKILEAEMDSLTTLQTEEEKDLTKDIIDKGHNCGLRNLGNICYINSTLQCLFTIPELISSLTSFPVDLEETKMNQASDDTNLAAHDITRAAHDSVLQLAASVEPVDPQNFVEMLQKWKPQFSKQHDNVYEQQDAEEFWTYLITKFEQALGSESSGSAVSLIKELFGIELIKRSHDATTGEDQYQADFMYSLKCYISEGIGHLIHGLLLVNSKNNGKSSPDRASFNESKIVEIPRYLTIHFLRLNWTVDSEQPGKVFQKVDYPAIFDIKDYCSDELKEKLEVAREAFGGSSNEGIDKDVMSSSWKTQQLTGIYDLVCILTHEGETADQGHYVSWIKKEGDWIKYDDEVISISQEDEVLRLSGGGAGPVAYICLYKGQTSQIPVTPSGD